MINTGVINRAYLVKKGIICRQMTDKEILAKYGPTPPPPGAKPRHRKVSKKRKSISDINYCPFCGRYLRGDKNG